MIEKLLVKSVITGGVLFSLLSCRSSGEAITTGETNVRINLLGSGFSQEGTLGGQAATKHLKPNDSKQQQELALNDDYKLVAVLSPDNSQPLTASQASLQAATPPLKDTNNLGYGIKYKVVVYDGNGRYITEKDYVSGDERNAAPITGLNGGYTYTFVVYSTGSKTIVPSVTYPDQANKTLATASVEEIPGSSDLMYFSKTMEITGNNTNYLDVVFSHQFSQVTVYLDATPTQWYNITNLEEVSISPHYDKAKMLMTDGSIISEQPAAKGSIVSFPLLSAKSVKADPVYINTNKVTDGIFRIKTILMTHQNDAPVSLQNIALNDLKITPGVKYNLKITLQPNDKYLFYRGYQAVRLSGMIWMRHNLGADMMANPDVPAQQINGDYYQFGRKTPAANVTTPANSISKWDISSAPNDAWNSGSFLVAVKTANDPCPEGWRLPTNREINALDKGTNKSTTGIVQNSSTNYSAAKVLTSVFDPTIKMTIPFSGYRSASDGTLLSRGERGGFWSATPNFSNTTQAVQWALYDMHPVNSNYPWATRSEAVSVRCIAIFPLDR
ncbi:FISUMP domain-containing protein [Elizabethkingia ursingii]|uniref:Fibrobacter succinogenes major paralogous domain-containing protein n=1 Tax=Elizabethkingia ursingii TaxID=1756150 RepID=A0AAJ3NAT0_9FLAO|nr:FISUMP domain-containing protein [Elizabethkingia ursingii]AQX07994.1 hypothetical protein BBD34_04755 [Elizabethkingia ursingii]OPB73652.1 hypothetical protein BAY32_11465 [Elizabethkingia ursingii]